MEEIINNVLSKVEVVGYSINIENKNVMVRVKTILLWSDSQNNQCSSMSYEEKYIPFEKCQFLLDVIPNIKIVLTELKQSSGQ